MKSSHAFGIRRVELACAATIALVSLYYAGASCLDQGYRPRSADLTEVRPAEVACALPDGWQADWRGELLWITHYNSNGTVADALPFDSLDGLYDWVEDHPDFCDVDVEKRASRPAEAGMYVTTGSN